MIAAVDLHNTPSVSDVHQQSERSTSTACDERAVGTAMDDATAECSTVDNGAISTAALGAETRARVPFARRRGGAHTSAVRRAWLFASVCGALACGGTSLTSLPDASTQDASVSQDAAAESDASASDVTTPVDATADTGSTSDADKYVDPGITCGGTYCPEASELCCTTITSYYPSYTYAYACEALSDLVQCPAGIAIYCDDDTECTGGDVCCGNLGNPTYTKVSCQPTCTGNVFGYQQIHFCNPNAADCGTGQTCKPSPQMPDYYVCQ